MTSTSGVIGLFSYVYPFYYFVKLYKVRAIGLLTFKLSEFRGFGIAWYKSAMRLMGYIENQDEVRNLIEATIPCYFCLWNFFFLDVYSIPTKFDLNEH
jgi:hypothetical protein